MSRAALLLPDLCASSHMAAKGVLDGWWCAARCARGQGNAPPLQALPHSISFACLFGCRRPETSGNGAPPKGKAARARWTKADSEGEGAHEQSSSITAYPPPLHRYELTVYDVLRHGALVLTAPAARAIAARLARPPLLPRQAAQRARLVWWAQQQAQLTQALAALQAAEQGGGRLQQAGAGGALGSGGGGGRRQRWRDMA